MNTLLTAMQSGSQSKLGSQQYPECPISEWSSNTNSFTSSASNNGQTGNVCAPALYPSPDGFTCLWIVSLQGCSDVTYLESIVVLRAAASDFISAVFRSVYVGLLCIRLRILQSVLEGENTSNSTQMLS